MGKLVVLIFFVIAVVVFALIKYAARGVAAGYAYVNHRDQLAQELDELARRRLPPPPSMPTQTGLMNWAASSAQRDNALLNRFAARLRQQGFGATPFDEPGAGERICGLLAGEFARLANGGTLAPSRPFSGHDMAVAWVGVVAVDVATQRTNTDFELASLAVSIPLVVSATGAAENPQKVADDVVDLMMAASQLHNKLVSTGQVDETAAGIARSFMEWALEGRDAGLFALRRSLPKLAANIEATMVA